MPLKMVSATMVVVDRLKAGITTEACIQRDNSAPLRSANTDFDSEDSNTECNSKPMKSVTTGREKLNRKKCGKIAKVKSAESGAVTTFAETKIHLVNFDEKVL